MKNYFYLLSLVAGIAVAIQTGVNTQLRNDTNSPVFTALISFAIGTVALTIKAFNLPGGNLLAVYWEPFMLLRLSSRLPVLARPMPWDLSWQVSLCLLLLLITLVCWVCQSILFPGGVYWVL